MQSLLVNI